MSAERKPGEREKCHKFYCPNQPAWIPAGQNGCPHCAGTATRGFCICETASADEIREMYTSPAPKTPSPEVGTTCKDLLQLAEPEAVWLQRMTRLLAGDGATGLIIRNHLRTIIAILRMVAPSAVKDSLTVQQPECALCGAAADLISVCDDAEACVRRTIAAAKEQSK